MPNRVSQRFGIVDKAQSDVCLQDVLFTRRHSVQQLRPIWTKNRREASSRLVCHVRHFRKYTRVSKSHSLANLASHKVQLFQVYLGQNLSSHENELASKQTPRLGRTVTPSYVAFFRYGKYRRPARNVYLDALGKLTITEQRLQMHPAI